MTILLLFAFLSGLVTILAPCIWPLLPIILSTSSTGGKRKPLGITFGIMTSFTLFTLTISTLVALFHFDPDILRLIAVVVIGLLGLTLIIPSLSKVTEGLVSRFTGSLSMVLPTKGSGFIGGYITGFSLGIVWSPCAGPILATIATLSATAMVNTRIVAVTLAYVAGIGIPLFIFATAGSYLLTKSRSLSPYLGRIQQVFGVIMIVTAVLIYTNYDKVIQAKLLDLLPAYSNFIYELENNEDVKKELDLLRKKKIMPEKKPSVNSGSKILPNLGQAPEFEGIAKWLNTDTALTMKSLRGKVVLIDFWTYTCINCIRTLPHVTGWYEKYKDKGFIVIGVHTPEFEFEKKTSNVEMAIAQHKITYPVAQDNRYETWNAYDNHYWPAKYLIDAKGNIRYSHFGEGEYDTTEKNIQILLAEAGATVGRSLMDLPDQTPRIRQTPETYLGSLRMERFESKESLRNGIQNYSLPADLPVHSVAFGGKWNVQSEYSESQTGSVLELRFNSNKVHLVITPKNKDDLVKVYLDGKLIGQVAGADVVDGRIRFGEEQLDNLYRLIDLAGDAGEHLLRLEFESEGVKVYAFTFG